MILLLLSLAGGLIATDCRATPTQKNMTSTKTTELTGPVQLSQLEKIDWFQATYNSTIVQSKGAEFTSLKNVMPQFEVRIYLGTWCGDTHDQLPAFVRIMKEAGVDASKFKYIALDRKKMHAGFTNPDKIEKLPTFVFYRDGQEVGRIIETPKRSLLEDTAAIIQKAIR